MKGYCFWCGAPLDHHDETNPAYQRYGKHEVMFAPGSGPIGLEHPPVVGAGQILEDDLDV